MRRTFATRCGSTTLRGTDKKGTQSRRRARSHSRWVPAQVIPGFEQGVVGMRVGGKRRINVPASLAYGTPGQAPNIPPNAALVFEIELLELV